MTISSILPLAGGYNSSRANWKGPPCICGYFKQCGWASHSTAPQTDLSAVNIGKRNLMEAEVQHLLDINAIEPVPTGQEGRGFYSILFLVQKSSGGRRGILDLKQYTYIVYRRFKIQSLQSILGCIREGDLMTSIDLKVAYLHVPIRPNHRKFLRFTYAGSHFQYQAVPFGLSSAPRTFTKLLAAVAANIRALPVRLQCYLNDILIQSISTVQAQRDLHTVSLQRHRFSINSGKSHLVPSTCLFHLMRGVPLSRPKGQHQTPDSQNLISAISSLGSSFPTSRENDLLCSNSTLDVASCETAPIVPVAPLEVRE